MTSEGQLMKSFKSKFGVQNLISWARKSSLKSASFLFLVMAVTSLVALPSHAQSDDVRRLKENIATLKSKIRTSNAKDPKDIQRLYRLENELEKKQYLRKNNKGR